MHLKMDDPHRVLHVAFGLSLLVHAVALSIHFKVPETLRAQLSNQPLEVVLVNAKTKERPVTPRALAQANLDRGGNVDERRRARTPLPVTEPRQPGRDLADAQRRARQPEAQQQELLAQTRPAKSSVPSGTPKQAPAEAPATPQSGRDLADLALAAMRLQAQIEKQVQEYEQRPRKKHIGASTTEYRFAQYEEEWRTKVERVGSLNYPEGARGRLYGSLRLTVTLRADGSVEAIELDRSSGLKVLDDAAFKIVRMGARYAPFPANIRRDTDLLVITRTWFFGQGDKIWTE